jgi:carbon-monoxide dehydrogenase medium subunit
MRNFDYLEPTTVAEACALLKQHGGEAKVFAGGSHLTILMKQGLYQPRALVNIKKISELKGIKYDEKEGLSVGALVTHREIETSGLVREKFPVLCDAEREVANIRVRNMGTVGGNLASGEPITDLSQIFIAMDGQAKIAGPVGQRTIPIEELFVAYHELAKMKFSPMWCCRRSRRARVSSTFASPAAPWWINRRRAWRYG